MRHGRLPDPLTLDVVPEGWPNYGAPWWSYMEKGAWANFAWANPEAAAAIQELQAGIGGVASTDPILASGIQIEGKWLRIATLLGLVEFDWTAPTRYAQAWIDANC